MTEFDPLAGKLSQGQFKQPNVLDVGQFGDDEGMPAGRQDEPKKFNEPADPFNAQGEPIDQSHNWGLGEIHNLHTQHDNDVRQAWTDYQVKKGVPPAQWSDFPPGYTSFAEHNKNRGVLGPTETPPVDNGPQPQQSSEPSAPAPVPPSTQGSTGGGGGSYSASASASGPVGGLGPIMHDYDEQLAGMEEEKAAKQAGNEAIGQQYGQTADEQRGLANEQLGAAQADSSNARRHIDEIGQLVQDYAQQKIDPMKWYGDKSVPQKVATVIGAMLAGWQGGPKGAQDFINNQMDRSIALQQEQLGREGQAIGVAQNLFSSFLKTSENEQQAYDKTRAAMLTSSMLEVQKAATAARTGEEQAQIDQLMGGLKLQRDMLIARLSAAQSAAGGAGAGAPNPNGLEIDPKSIATGSNGQQYLITNPAYSDDISQNLAVFGRLKDSIKQGQQILNERNGNYGWLAPYSENLQRGEAVTGAIYETASKLASARGMPQGLAHVVQQLVPNFSSRLAGPTGAAKIPEVLNLLDQYEQEYLKAAGAVPSKVTIGPGHGKEAYKLKYYAQPGVSTQPGQQAAQAGQQPGSRLKTFQPGQ